MTDRPILFSAPMVRALLAGTKTQTRRILKAEMPERPAHDNIVHAPKHDAPYLDAYCGQRRTPENPRGMTGKWAWWTRDDRPGSQFDVRYVPGDRLWVRETTVIAPRFWTSTPVNPRGPDRRETAYLADSTGSGVMEAARDYGLKATPSIFMPRWASRLTLTVTDVRVERLQDISEADAIAEGAPRCMMDDDGKFYDTGTGNYRTGYAGLWNHINGKRRAADWDSNPWVVALTFTVAQRNIDDAPVAGGRLSERESPATTKDQATP